MPVPLRTGAPLLFMNPLRGHYIATSRHKGRMPRQDYSRLDGHRSSLTTKAEVAELIERFLENRLTYQQEWNDFVECREPDAVVDSYRKRCYDLDALVNRPDPVDEDAVAQLRGILLELR